MSRLQALGSTPAEPVPPPKNRWLLKGGVLFGAAAVALGIAATSRSDADPVDGARGRIFTSPLGGLGTPAALTLDYARLDARFAAIMAEPDMVGLAVAIVEDGRISFVKGYGVTEATRTEPVTPTTVFRWASLSKSVAGTLVAELAREGAVSLDAPVSRYRTSLRLPGGGEAVVTVADVLSHRVGLVRNAYDERLEDGQDPRAIRGALAMLPPYCPPATCYAYQNIAFDTATEIAEHATGRTYTELTREKLFAPLGMSSASVGRAGLETAPSWARPHRGRTVLPTKDAYYRVPAAGGVNSSIFDLAKWMRAQMGGGLLPDDLLLTTQTPLVPTPPRGRRGAIDRALSAQGYGLGWRSLTYAGRQLTGHRGAVDGYRSLILFDSEAKAGIAMLWNSNSNKPVGMQLEMLDMLYALPRQDWVTLGQRGGMPATAEPSAAAPLDGRRRPGSPSGR